MAHPATGALYLLLGFYAIFPLLAACIWFATGGTAGGPTRGPVDFPPLLAAAVLVVGVALRQSLRAPLPRPTPLEAGALALAAAAFAASLLLAAPEPALGALRLLEKLVYVAVAILLCRMIAAAPEGAARAATLALALQPLVHLPMLVYLYLAHVDDPAMNWRGGPVGYWHVRIWGMTLAVGLVAAIGLAAGTDPRRRSLLIAGPAIFLLALMLFWSGSRGPIAGAFAGVLVATLACPGRMLRWLPAALLLMAAGAAASAALALPYHAYGVFRAVDPAALADLEAASAGRLAIWERALALIAERPWLGHGHDQFAVLQGEARLAIQPHNALLQLALDAGIVGAAAVTALLASLSWRGLRRARAAADGPRIAALAALVALAVMAMVDGVLYHDEPLLMLALVFAVLFAAPPAAALP